MPCSSALNASANTGCKGLELLLRPWRPEVAMLPLASLAELEGAPRFGTSECGSVSCGPTFRRTSSACLLMAAIALLNSVAPCVDCVGPAVGEGREDGCSGDCVLAGGTGPMKLVLVENCGLGSSVVEQVSSLMLASESSCSQSCQRPCTSRVDAAATAAMFRAPGCMQSFCVGQSSSAAAGSPAEAAGCGGASGAAAASCGADGSGAAGGAAGGDGNRVPAEPGGVAPTSL